MMYCHASRYLNRYAKHLLPAYSLPNRDALVRLMRDKKLTFSARSPTSQALRVKCRHERTATLNSSCPSSYKSAARSKGLGARGEARAASRRIRCSAKRPSERSARQYAALSAVVRPKHRCARPIAEDHARRASL